MRGAGWREEYLRGGWAVVRTRREEGRKEMNRQEEMQEETRNIRTGRKKCLENIVATRIHVKYILVWA